MMTISADQNVPGEDRHPEHGHAGCAQRQDRRDDVDRAEDGAHTGEHQANQPQVRAHARRVLDVGQRLVSEPAEVGGSAWGGESGQHHEATEQVQPVGQRVQPRE
jgi:hypothetical protein